MASVTGGPYTGKVGTCVFPFTYGDVVYSSCAEVSLYGGVGWCSHKAVADDEDWGYCKKTICPIVQEDTGGSWTMG